jgi:hypothetical protein
MVIPSYIKPAGASVAGALVAAGASVATAGAWVAWAGVAGFPHAVSSTLKTIIKLNNFRSIFLLFMKFSPSLLVNINRVCCCRNSLQLE